MDRDQRHEHPEPVQNDKQIHICETPDLPADHLHGEGHEHQQQEQSVGRQPHPHDLERDGHHQCDDEKEQQPVRRCRLNGGPHVYGRYGGVSGQH